LLNSKVIFHFIEKISLSSVINTMTNTIVIGKENSFGYWFVHFEI